MNKNKLILLFSIILFASSCANYKLNYSHEGKKWTTNTAPTDQKVKHTMYLIGDAGNSSKDEVAPAIKLLETKLKTADKNSSVIFLGDNIYPNGMPRKSEGKEYDLAKHRIDVQLDILKDYDGRILFLPGNHDWKENGLKGLKRQEKYIEKHLNKGILEKDDWNNYFLPDRGCGDPQVIEINDQLVLVILDSQWFLTDWDKEPEINDGCEIKSRKEFKFHFEEIVRKYRNKNVVIAMHHPLFSYGPHAGYATAKEHLFPLTQVNKNLYIPLPIVGSFATMLRGTIGVKGDLNHLKYKEFIASIMAGASKNGSYIFASGHEHNLQYIFENNQHQIVSGSGSKLSPVAKGKGAEFGYGHAGISQIDFYEDGSAWLKFWITDDNAPDGKLVFQKKIKDKLLISEDNIPESFPEYESQLQQVTKSTVSNKIEEKGKMYEFFLGSHYRNVYSEQYEFPVLDLAKYKGGLTPIKRGGGNQTNSLRLQGGDGHQYVMRSLTKDASRVVPFPFNKMTAASTIVGEVFLSSHPFAALAVGPMADASNVYHTNPKLFYIPKQPLLGVHNDLFGGTVYLVEERTGGNWEDNPDLGNGDKLISTADLAEKISESHKHKVDQRWLLRSRLFDQIIGDWDRHDDQWRWARIKVNKDSTTYRAIPRDRDQPFSKYDGLLMTFARGFMPFLKQLKVYSPKIKNMKWSSWSPKYVDNSFLNEMEWSDWEAEANFLKTNLTDEVIEKAFESWPEKAQELTAAQIIDITKKRRDQIVEFAERHYKLLAKRVDVYGTDKHELFQIDRLDNEQTRVRVYHKKKKGNRLVYDRTFNRAITDEIDIYGLDNDDEFHVTGKVKKGILLRLIGGLGKDKFVDESKVAGLSKKTKVYDNLQKNEYDLGSEAKNLSSSNTDLNVYDRRHIHYEYDVVLPAPSFGYNSDDGLFLGADLLFTKYKFKKSPYSSIQRFVGNVSTATGGIDVLYEGEFIQFFGKQSLIVDGIYRTDRSAFNYFGLGNNTELSTDDFNFNRVRQSLIHIHPAIKKPFSSFGSGLSFGPIFEVSQIEETANRFIVSDATGLPSSIFDSNYFLGAKIQIDYDNKDNLNIPTRGIHFIANASWMTDLEATERDFKTLNSSLTIYQNLDRNARFVIATKIGASHRIGDYPFFKSAILDGNSNLRGYRAERFYGKTSFYHNTDLRIKAFGSINKILPFTMGLLGGYDYGRVWLDGEDSDQWHSSYGGGIWIAPVDVIIVNLALFHSKEEDRFTVKFSFDF